MVNSQSGISRSHPIPHGNHFSRIDRLRNFRHHLSKRSIALSSKPKFHPPRRLKPRLHEQNPPARVKNIV
ncbi:MAG: hypothetical protein NT070_15760 [Cyanobacteria bacterium]|nr:hypothetical protein [Cyanobacteriota bacterium]